MATAQGTALVTVSPPLILTDTATATDTATGALTGPPLPSGPPRKTAPTGAWSARVRRGSDLRLTDPIQFSTATLTENYNVPDMLVLSGRLRGFPDAVTPGSGVVLYDDEGTQRFSGHLIDFERKGDHSGAFTYASDLVYAWWRLCWPNPANAWTTDGQDRQYDSLSASAEDRILYYIDRNLGQSARTERRHLRLRKPPSQDRGPTAKTNARFQQLGQLVADLAELANVRVRIVTTYSAPGTPWLDVVVDDAPDLSAWARFGTGPAGGPGMLASDWRYHLGLPTVTHSLAAAGGEGKDRLLVAAAAADGRDTLWNGRIEGFLDQRGIGERAAKQAELEKLTAESAARVRARANADRALDIADSNYDSAQYALSQNTGNTAAQNARTKALAALQKAQTAYNDAVTEANTAAAAVVAATAARDAAAVADMTAINEGLQEALLAGVGVTEISAPLGTTELVLGRDVPVGAKILADLDGATVVERLRQVKTVIGRNGTEPSVKITGTLGSDAGLKSPSDRKLAAALRKAINLERAT